MTIRASRDEEAIQPVGAETRKRERRLFARSLLPSDPSASARCAATKFGQQNAKSPSSTGIRGCRAPARRATPTFQTRRSRWAAVRANSAGWSWILREGRKRAEHL